MEVHPRVAQPCPQRGFPVRTPSGRSGSCGRVALLILMCAMSSGCDSYVRRHADQGDLYFKDRKYREAVAEYVKAIRFSADDPHILRQLGLAHFNLGEPRDAFTYLTKSELLKPGDPEVRISLGKIYLANQRPDEAVREAKLVLASDPRNADALDLLASAYLIQNDPAKAIETYRRLVELFPRSAERHYALGVSLMAGQQTSDARKELETALALAARPCRSRQAARESRPPGKTTRCRAGTRPEADRGRRPQPEAGPAAGSGPGGARKSSRRGRGVSGGYPARSRPRRGEHCIGKFLCDGWKTGPGAASDRVRSENREECRWLPIAWHHPAVKGRPAGGPGSRTSRRLH